MSFQPLSSTRAVKATTKVNDIDFSSIAGSEATSITLTYVLWILVKHVEIERRLRAELATLPKEYSSLDLATLPYLDAVLRETLRVYPPAPSPMPRVVPAHGFSMDGVVYPPNVRSSSDNSVHETRCADTEFHESNRPPFQRNRTLYTGTPSYLRTQKSLIPTGG